MLRTRSPRDRLMHTDLVGILGEGTTLEGNLELKGGYRVDGRVVGRVSSPSILIVGPSGEVEVEDLRVRSLTVSGVVRDNLHIEEWLEIASGGRVYGKITLLSAGLVILPGGLLDAAIEMPESIPRETQEEPHPN